LPLGRDWIEAHIPHRGAMCLLDGVLEWDARHVVCRASSHGDPANPLRVGGTLPAACGIEYGAQAMAVHGGLRAPPDQGAAPGYLVAVRNAQLHAARLDDIAADLEVSATCRVADPTGLAYDFTVSAGGRLVAEGRATVALRARDAR